MKQAITLEQQVNILKKRGMLIDMGDEKANEILSDIGYFRLGFYCFPFEISYPDKRNRTHHYKQGTKFSDVVDLYYFDVDLRNILLKYLNRIEINFRTKIVYIVSNQYIDCNTWFVNPVAMQKNFIDKFEIGLYTKNFRKNPVIKRHHKKYINDKYAPAWKTLEFFTFGAMLKIFKNLKEVSLKKTISLNYNIRNENIFENYFNALVEIRNLCAHSSTLFDHTLSRRLLNGPAIKITDNNSFKLYSAIKIAHFIVDKISNNRANQMKNEIEQLFANCNNSKINEIILLFIGK
jgi:abortive infection bacteriophage resistance protein